MKEFFKGLFSKKQLNRIWELDAFRGICLICMVIIHVLFDMQQFFGLKFSVPIWLQYLQEYGGIFFMLLSGICVTLGHHNIRRGLIVAAAAVLVTVSTILTVPDYLRIYFGILHLLAFSMLTYSFYRKLPWWAIIAIGTGFAALGFYFKTITVSTPYLFPLGLVTADFCAGDFFPVFPNVGFFMIGAGLGKIIYKDKETLFKKVDPDFFLIRFFAFCGRHSLLIYLLHQPLVLGVFYGVKFISAL